MTTKLSRDAIIAILLLLGCGVLFWSTFSIRMPNYGQMTPATWPRTVLVGLTVLSMIYLFQSLRQGVNSANDPDQDGDKTNRSETDTGDQRQPGLLGWISYWRNPLWCYLLFFIYLVTLPVLGSLIGGVLFVFTLMGLLGGWGVKNVLQHAGLALFTVGGMWTIFTFGLGVILPPGEIFSPF
jgi:putative tricarboxylic transport membrane protein